MAVSDYLTIFDMWSNPHASMTKCRLVIEEVLTDDFRFQSFVDEARARKQETDMHRGFYLYAKFYSIGMTSDKGMCLDKMTQLLQHNSENCILAEVVSRMMLNCLDSAKSPISDQEIQKIKQLATKAAADGNKNAIRSLGLLEFKTGSIKDSAKVDDIFPASTLIDDDPYYRVFYQHCKYFLGPESSLNDFVEAVIRCDMSSNISIFSIIVDTAGITMIKNDFLTMMGQGDEESCQEKQNNLDALKRLYYHFELCFAKVRILPKHRDPFRQYWNELSDEQINRIEDWKTYIMTN